MRQLGSDFIPRATVETVLSSGKLGHPGLVRATLGTREVGTAQVLAGQSCQTKENQSGPDSLSGDRSSSSVCSSGDLPVVGKLQGDTAWKPVPIRLSVESITQTKDPGNFPSGRELDQSQFARKWSQQRARALTHTSPSSKEEKK